MPDSSQNLTIVTLGGLELRLDDAPIANLASRKAEALLAYLACSDRPQPRDTLADLLWPHLPANRARGNLSVLLSSLRQQVGRYIQANRQTLAFDHSQPHWLDVAALEAAWQHARGAPTLNAAEAEQLDRALALYRGDFLQGFAIRESPGFEAWVLAEQERVRRLVVQARHALMAAAAQRRAYDAAIAQARSLLRLDALREDVHRELMRLLLASGQRGAALEQYAICRSVLSADLGIAPAPETEALYDEIRTVAERTPQVGAPPRSWARRGRAPLNNLPSQPTPFLGRAAELAQLVQLLSDPTRRLLTLVGPGGIGKTRLAIEAAAIRSAACADGVAFVALAAIERADQLVDAIGAALRLSFVGQSDPQAHLLSCLRDAQLLLVLDNFEHLSDGADLVATLIEHAPHLSVLVTSRERLGLRAEWLFDVEGLAYPEQPGDAATLQQYSAAQLFVQQASRVQPRFALGADDAAAVARVCQLLDGSPLAIELAAAWARSVSCATIASTIASSLDALASDLRDAPPRHRSMRAVFAHSWELLPLAERTLLMELSLVRGGATAEAVAAICKLGQGENALPSLAQALRVLSERALLREVEGRYSMHELLRQFAAERLAQHDERWTRALWSRYARYYLDLVARQGALLGGAAAQPAAAAIRADLANIRQAWAAAPPEQLAPAVDGLARFYELIGSAQEGAEIFGAAAQALGQATAADQRRVYARLRVEHGRFLSAGGNYAAAIAQLAAAAELARQLGLSEIEALARCLWGDTLGCQGAYAPARAQLVAALGLVRGQGWAELEGDTLGALGTVEEEQGDYPAAAAHYARSLELSRALGDRARESLALTRLGVVAEEQGQYAQARDYYTRALALHREADNRRGAAVVLNNLGVVYRDESQYDAAQATLLEALALSRELSNRRLTAVVLTNLADVARDLGAYDSALEHVHQAMALREELGNQHGVCQNMADLGLVLHLCGENEEARACSERALARARAIAARSIEAFALTHLGHALLALEQPEDADVAYQQALVIRRELAQPNRALDAIAGLARVALTLRDRVRQQALAETLLRHVERDDLHGAEEPTRIALTCIQALAAVGDGRAGSLLDRVYAGHQARAASIANLATRHMYTEKVMAHVALRYAFEQRRVN